VVSQVHIHRGRWHGGYRLSDETVPTISAFLSSEDEWSPKPLKANANKSFQGSIVLGLGFTLSEDEATALIARDPKNAEVLFSYLNGEDLNSHPAQKPSRWVINFWDWPLDRSAEGSWESAAEDKRAEWLRNGHVPADYRGRAAADFPEVLAIVIEKVKPERQRRDERGQYVLRRPLPQRWWHYADKRPALYHTIGRGHPFARHPEGWDSGALRLDRVLINARVSRHFNPSLYPNTVVFHEKIVIMIGNRFEELALMNSSVVQAWVWNQSSTMKMDLNFSPSDSYETLPRPEVLPAALENLGAAYAQCRTAFMVAEQVGLTTTYNRFHDEDDQDSRIAELRSLHCQIDCDVIAAYGWQDMALNHDFHPMPHLPENDRIRYNISEDARLEILRRLSRLNRERYQAELRQAEEERRARATDRPAPVRRGKRPKLGVIQGGLF
jgi:hypothetical protein